MLCSEVRELFVPIFVIKKSQWS